MATTDNGDVHFLKEWRQWSGLGQREFAARSGMSLSNYNYLETGKVGLTQKSLSTIARYYGIDPGDLLCVDPLDSGPDDVEYQVLKVMADHMSPAAKAEAGGLLAMVLRIDQGDVAGTPGVPGRPAVGHFLKEWRAALGMTQAEFAAAAGLATSNYNYLEIGKINYTQASLGAVSDAFGIRVSDLISLNPLSGLRHDPAFLHGWDTYRRLSPRGRDLACQLFRRICDHDRTADLQAEDAPGMSVPM